MPAESMPAYSAAPNSGGDRPPGDYDLAGYNFDLPPDRIAQTPAVPRDHSRLLVIGQADQQHRQFRDLPEFLQSGDLLVINNTKVIPARLYGHKLAQNDSGAGAKVEALLLEAQSTSDWLALVKPGRRLPIGTRLQFAPISPDAPPLTATIVDRDAPTNGRILRFDLAPGQSLLEILDGYGEMPLPPYISGRASSPGQYQTVYADRPGAVAAPTAGLHFTPELLANLESQGIGCATVTLHVGVGTFRPVEVADITQHPMHGEWIEVPEATVAAIRQAKATGGRVIAVGTTAVRALEGAAQAAMQRSSEDTELARGTLARSASDPAIPSLEPYCGKTHIFIYPGYQWQVVDGIITNFHLPQSSLLMLVAGAIGRRRLLDIYAEAIAREYRFYSFGDAMLILPEAKIEPFSMAESGGVNRARC
jgi:S-adenosylmethionine:tRNA ribosyltransferase-isomerase